MLRAIRRVCTPRQFGAGGILVVLIILLADPAPPGAATAASRDGEKGPGGGERLFSMEFRDVEVRDVLRALGQEAGLNIIVGEEVTGKATLSFRQVTVDNALEAILRSRGLTSLRQGNIIWVVPAGDKVEEGMEIRTFPFNYATSKELTNALKPATSKAGSLIVDERTNTLIAKDFPRNLDRVTVLLAKLDTITPQIMIEARIVETTKSFAHQLGIQWGGAYSRDAAHGTALPYRFPTTAITSGTQLRREPSHLDRSVRRDRAHAGEHRELLPARRQALGHGGCRDGPHPLEPPDHDAQQRRGEDLVGRQDPDPDGHVRNDHHVDGRIDVHDGDPDDRGVPPAHRHSPSDERPAGPDEARDGEGRAGLEPAGPGDPDDRLA
ncbi:MAG: secretin and TonB N-terminal domain-containing protein [Nitrospirae bacterium]|nr:secretin and TonB N-terminal domain-containing protein [Nitrospirota bacterium]